MALRVAPRPKGTTSTGSGKAPSRATFLLASAMTIMRSDAVATIFSRSKAPPPPLIRRSCRSSSSAPSMVRSSSGQASSVVSGTPSSVHSAAVRSDVGTPITEKPSRTFSASARTNCSAVDPVPMPSRMPDVTSSSAASAAFRFSSSLIASRSSPSRRRCGCRIRPAPILGAAVRRCGAGLAWDPRKAKNQRHPKADAGPAAATRFKGMANRAPLPAALTNSSSNRDSLPHNNFADNASRAGTYRRSCHAPVCGLASENH